MSKTVFSLSMVIIEGDSKNAIRLAKSKDAVPPRLFTFIFREIWKLATSIKLVFFLKTTRRSMSKSMH